MDRDYYDRLNKLRAGNPNTPPLASNLAEHMADQQFKRESSGSNSGGTSASWVGVIFFSLVTAGILIHAWWDGRRSSQFSPPPNVQRPAERPAVAPPAPLPPRADVPHYVVAPRGSDFISGFPTVEKVRSAFQADSALETAARQQAALDILYNALADLLGPRQFKKEDRSPAEDALARAYRNARKDIRDAILRDLPTNEQPAWNRRCMALEVSGPFRREVMEKMTTAAWRQRHISNWSKLAELPPAR